MNKILLIGNVGKDPDIRTTREGKKIANFSVATSERWRDKATGERREITDWHNVVIFSEGLVGVVEQYVKKGTKVYVCGKSKTRKWQDQAGMDRWTTEVVLQGFGDELELLTPREGRPQADSTDAYGQSKTYDQGSARGGNGGSGKSLKDELNDDIPFRPEWRG